LKNPAFTRDLLIAGVNEFAVSLYSVRDITHDRITQRTGSCRETKAGIRNLIALRKKFDISIRINTVLSSFNYRDLEKTITSLYKASIRDFIIAEEIIPKGKASHLSLPEIKDYLTRIRTLGLRQARIVFRGFAPCLLYPESANRRQNDLKGFHPASIRENHEVDTLIQAKTKKSAYMSKFNRLFSKRPFCVDCRFAHSCKGLQKRYFTD
jgi:MoaA/NifB/PqqE/SkfB family radical SAM enzyme